MKYEKPPVSFSEMGRVVGWKQEGLIPNPHLLLYAMCPSANPWNSLGSTCGQAFTGNIILSQGKRIS